MGEIFPRPVSEVVSTLAALFRLQGNSTMGELLGSAHASFDEFGYDNWNGGTYSWTLRLEIPLVAFARVEPALSSTEQAIKDKLASFNRISSKHTIDVVTILPIAPGSSLTGIAMSPAESEVRHLWADGKFRLFLSHRDPHKALVGKLKFELKAYGIDAFVAHEDIEPSTEWRDQIELGLKSMHALAALITPDFYDSQWTEQEVGWALGRGVLALPVRLGGNPRGFASKVQAVSGELTMFPAPLAKSIVAALLAHAQTRPEMKRSIVPAFAAANSFADAKRLRDMVLSIPIAEYSDEEKRSIRNAARDNGQVRDAISVPATIAQVFGKPDSTPAAVAEESPF